VNCIVTGSTIGISLNRGSNASFIAGNVGGKQVAVNVDGGHFTGKSITITGTRDAGVSAFAGAEVTLENCSIQQNDNYGIQVFNGAKVKAVQCFLSSSVDIFVLKKGKVKCVLCKFEGASQIHVHSQDGGIASLKDCELLSCQRGIGMQVSETGIVKLKGTHIHNQEKFAVAVCPRGVFRASEAAFYDCGSGGLYIDSETEVELVSCQIIRNGNIGIQALGGKVKLAHCTIREHRQVGILHRPNADVQEENTEFQGNGRDRVVQ
jgi:hypothetical protein